MAVDEDGGEIAGYVTLSNAEVEARRFPEELQKKLPRYPFPALRIGKLAVDTKFRHLGVGSWLLYRAIEKAPFSSSWHTNFVRRIFHTVPKSQPLA